ncbi:MAG: PQQ-binding-like beta-propeller repeat protein [Gemmataceae bacterium]|nr:PQQ-like beta-propeller repeat protein [Gemmata sp.]MDW8197613.1 PQQ-binding-like beta-propeller repeat protein [Gemmataceae bacterium]
MTRWWAIGIGASLWLLNPLVVPSAAAAEPAPWATYRGNPQRTGNTDGQAGPEKPGVLWSVKSQDHFLAAPVPVREGVYIAGVGAFNRPSVAVFPLAAKNPPVPSWTKSAPYLKLASVSSPAVAGEYLLFGDGLHQDSGGILHCLNATTGQPLWQLVLPGDLIHLEGAPTVVGGQVFMGGGGAGVFCVALDKAVLDGQEYSLAEVAKLQDKKWKELMAKFEEDKKKDPDFAIPPDDSQLLKFAPKKLWHKGAGKWHVDAPVNIAADMVLVPTSYLEKEKVGERALYALQAATGETVWHKELKYNPWGGATVAGDIVIVPGSSIGYYYKELKGAKGDLTALDLKTGQEKWRKEIPTGGILGCAAVRDGLVVCTATDGKVRAYKLADGERAWLYDAKSPFFAPPAVAGGVVYAADLAGTIHALDLKTGNPRWTFSLAQELNAPGMVYGGVIVHRGQLVVATCNLDGPWQNKPTVIVCLGQK